MANKILVARGTKARIEEIKGTLATNELVYSTDTGELGIKKANGNIEYFKNATDIDYIEGEVIQLQTDIVDKVDKVTGKGLSTNDYTNAEKTKLAGIEQGAEKNTVNSVNGKTGTVVIDKSDVGLPNVDDTSDLDKPISTAAQSALNLKADKTQLNNYVTTSTFDMQMLEKLGIKPNGTDLLIIDGMINPLYIDDTSYKVNHPTVNSQAEMLALDVPLGTVVVRLDTPSKELFLLTQLPASTLANWQVVSSNTVVSVAGKTGAVVLGITDISGLTSALNLKLDITTFEAQLTQLQTDIDSKVDKVSGKGLSTNDFTNSLKTKLDGIETGAQVNPYSKTQLDNKFNDKVDKNNAITAGTKTKITYDSKGLVTSGADLTEADIPTLPASKITQSTTARFVTDTEKSTWNGKQNALTAGDGISISGNVISADGGGGSEVIIDYLSTAQASSLEFTGISLVKGKVYKMFLSLTGVSSGASILINLNDMGSIEVTKQRLYAVGTTVSGTTETYNIGKFELLIANAARKNVVECTLFLDNDGSVHYLGNVNGETGDTGMNINQIGGIIRTTGNDPVTKITLSSNFVNQYNTGTIFKLWEVA